MERFKSLSKVTPPGCWVSSTDPPLTTRSPSLPGPQELTWMEHINGLCALWLLVEFGPGGHHWGKRGGRRGGPGDPPGTLPALLLGTDHISQLLY